MAVRCKCPQCDGEIVREQPFESGKLACEQCATDLTLKETRCVVCDETNALARRDSVHYWCLECGFTQTLYSHLRSAS